MIGGRVREKLKFVNDFPEPGVQDPLHIGGIFLFLMPTFAKMEPLSPRSEADPASLHPTEHFELAHDLWREVLRSGIAPDAVELMRAAFNGAPLAEVARNLGWTPNRLSAAKKARARAAIDLNSLWMKKSDAVPVWRYEDGDPNGDSWRPRFGWRHGRFWFITAPMPVPRTAPPEVKNALIGIAVILREGCRKLKTPSEINDVFTSLSHWMPRWKRQLLAQVGLSDENPGPKEMSKWNRGKFRYGKTAEHSAGIRACRQEARGRGANR